METDTDNPISPVIKDEPENEAPSNEIDDDGEDVQSLNGDSGGIITQKLYSSDKEKDKKHTNLSARENNGGLIIVDISKDICKVDSDDSESDDFKINDINRNKGLKRKASDATRSGDDEGSRSTETDEFGSLAKKSFKDEPVLSDSDFNIHKQTLGKGKRARIPNKRYSDILISPNRRLENGSERTSESEDTPPVKETTPQQPKKLRSAPGNANDPNFLEPFKFGWKRELVWRAISDERHKIAGDIYYYTPSGKKIRSLRELSEIVKNDPNGLSMDNFTFMKEPLGTNDPEKEIIRDAKRPSSTVKKVVSKSRSSKSGVLSPKKVSSPKVGKEGSEGSNSKSRSSSSKNLGNFKIKAPSKAKDKKFKPDESIESDLDAIKNSTPRKPVKWTSNSNTSGNKPFPPCSIRCLGGQGAIPTLQCRICLCLYHHECVGYTMHPTLPYVCKNCNLEDQTTDELSETTPLTSPPPLTPINSLKAVNTTTNVLPKLQRIPRNDVENDGEREEIVSASPPTLEPQLPPPMTRLSASELYPPPPPPPTLESSKSLVGAMTTWLPHHSKIVNEQTEAPRPQYLEVLNGRKFLVIPKHNFMSVSPSVAATASSRRPSINLLMDEQSQVPTAASLGESNADEETKLDPESPSKPENSQTQQAEQKEEKKGDVERNEENNENEVSDTSQSKGKSRAPPATQNAVATLDYSQFMSNYLQNVSYGYTTLLYVFQYLKVQDLLRAGCVCSLWRDIASQSQLWRTVRMKNSQVQNFEGLANTLRKHGTVHLDLRKMLLPGGGDDIWPQFSKAIRTVDTLKKIEFCRCPAKVVEQVAGEKTDLEVINAVTIKCECMSLEPFANLTNIKELRLKSTQGLTLTSDLKALKELKWLKILSLTSIKELNKLDLSIIAELSSLESLDLGECTDFQENFGQEILGKLENLEKLRLEKGQGECHTFEILKAVKDMKKLEQLELVNFDIKPGFDLALGSCSNIRKLLIIPTYISQSATTNHMVLGGVLRLHKSLSHFVWGVTLELLRVTELFVDQQSDDSKKDRKELRRRGGATGGGGGDSCIPVLKPVPVIVDGKSDNIMPAHDPPQVEILPLPNLQKLLLQSLPNTRVKILKIPFHATWRQSITDSVTAK